MPIPLDRVAEDARPLIRRFREAGSVSFQDLELAESRDTYVRNCRLNAPECRAPVAASDRAVGGVACRVYEPAGMTPDAPTVLFFHGGGWVIGDLDTHDAVCRVIAGAAESRVISADYRLAPEHGFPAAHDDVLAVADAVLGTADGSLLPDPDLASGPVVVAGDSAGGNLAIWVARADAEGRFARSLSGQVLFYPNTDLTCSMPSHGRIAEGFPLTSDSVAWFASRYAGDHVDRRHPALSPLLHDAPDRQAPVFITTVGLDPLADEGIAYAGLLASSGVPVEHHHLPRHPHGLVASSGSIATGRWMLERSGAFVLECARAAAAAG